MRLRDFAIQFRRRIANRRKVFVREDSPIREFPRRKKEQAGPILWQLDGRSMQNLAHSSRLFSPASAVWTA